MEDIYYCIIDWLRRLEKLNNREFCSHEIDAIMDEMEVQLKDKGVLTNV